MHIRVFVRIIMTMIIDMRYVSAFDRVQQSLEKAALFPLGFREGREVLQFAKHWSW